VALQVAVQILVWVSISTIQKVRKAALQLAMEFEDIISVSGAARCTG
jgi:hypothetical protein